MRIQDKFNTKFSRFRVNLLKTIKIKIMLRQHISPISISRRLFIASLFKKKRPPPYIVKTPSELESVVIGGGMGGLMGAAYLAKNGFPVTLIDQNAKVGGYAGAFERMNKKYRFEQVVHITSFNTGFSKFLGELGISLDTQGIVTFDEIARYKSTKYDITIPANIDQMCEVINTYIPGEEANVRKICALAINVNKEITALRLSNKPCPKWLFPFKYPYIFKYHKKTIKEAIDPITTNPDIMDFLFTPYNLCMTDCSTYVASIISLHFLGRAVTGGSQGFGDTSQRLADSLADVITSNGGKILSGKRVTGILRDGGRVKGVSVADQSMIPAKVIISNLNPISTYEQLVSEKTPEDKEYLEQINKRNISASCVNVYLGLNKDITDILPNSETLVFDKNNTQRTRDGIFHTKIEDKFYVVTNYNTINKPNTPGTTVITLYTNTTTEDWLQYEDDYKKGMKSKYNKKKQEIADIMIDRAEKDLIPGLREMIEVREISTPLTNIRYSGNVNGAVIAFTGTPEHVFRSPVLAGTTVPGLYFAGAWVRPSGGIIGSAMSGKLAYNEIRKDYGV